jgi:hypothetical protein
MLSSADPGVSCAFAAQGTRNDTKQAATAIRARSEVCDINQNLSIALSDRSGRCILNQAFREADFA